MKESNVAIVEGNAALKEIEVVVEAFSTSFLLLLPYESCVTALWCLKSACGFFGHVIQHKL